MGEPTAGTELLTAAITREQALAALAERPHRRGEIQEKCGFSKSTCHRVIRSFEEHGLVERDGDQYALTELGRVVEAKVRRFSDGVRTARRLVPLLEAFGSAPVDVDVDLFTDATITRPSAEDPTPPVDRHMELFAGCRRIRTLDRTSFTPPLHVEKLFELAVENDAEGTVIFPASIVEKRIGNHPEIHRELASGEGRIEYRVYEGVPFGMTIYDDDAIGLRVYDDETGALVLFVDTDDPEAVAWAADVFASYAERSTPAAAIDDLPDWL